MTRYLNFSDADLNVARQLICGGGLVAFPTETVYGLGGNAFDSDAIKKIFIAKGRPSDNPLILHLCKVEQLFQVAESLTADAKRIAEKLMPGSLTIVVKKKSYIDDIVTAGLDTVAVRVPQSPEALKFLQAVGVPVAAPSANVSTKISPTSWKAVSHQLDGKIDAILMGSDCQVGIESTVLDLTGDTPVILRPGIVTKSQIEAVVGKEVSILTDPSQKVNSPGLKYKHYAPDCPAILNTDGDTKKINDFFYKLKEQGKTPVLLTDKLQDFEDKNTVFLGQTQQEVAKNIYAKLEYCQKNFDYIVIVFTQKGEVADSILNRLTKATGGQTL